MRNLVADGSLLRSEAIRAVEAVEVALALRIERAADAGSVAEAMAAVWQQIHRTVRPIIGEHGIAALFQRSLHLAARTHPWLSQTRDGDHVATDPAAMGSVFAQQSREAAAAGAGTLLQTFCGLLASLIGLPLTEQLLRPIGGAPTGKRPAPDSNP